MIPDYMFEHLEKAFAHDSALSMAIRKSRALSNDLRSNPRETFMDSIAKVCERITTSCGNTTTLPGTTEATEDTVTFTDDTIKIGHGNAAIVRDYQKNVLNRNSYDNSGTDLVSCCHYDKDFDNAFFDGQQMIYGDGQLFKPLVLALDVAAHEIGHGVISSTANLHYLMESGALNESYADVFGETCEHYHGKIKIVDSDWLMGEGVISDQLKAKGWKAIRSFKDELAYPDDPQPKVMKDYMHTVEDNFGVHINSGIINRAFYEFCVNSKVEYSYNEPLTVWYQALLTLNNFSGFSSMKKATLAVCAKQYPNLVEALQAAWTTVGV